MDVSQLSLQIAGWCFAFLHHCPPKNDGSETTWSKNEPVCSAAIPGAEHTVCWISCFVIRTQIVSTLFLAFAYNELHLKFPLWLRLIISVLQTFNSSRFIQQMFRNPSFNLLHQTSPPISKQLNPPMRLTVKHKELRVALNRVPLITVFCMQGCVIWWVILLIIKSWPGQRRQSVLALILCTDSHLWAKWQCGHSVTRSSVFT